MIGRATVPTPIGIFYARRTRDGEALYRDGQAYFERRYLPGNCHTMEVRFADGLWMIAEPADLEPAWHDGG